MTDRIPGFATLSDPMPAPARSDHRPRARRSDLSTHRSCSRSGSCGIVVRGLQTLRQTFTRASATRRTRCWSSARRRARRRHCLELAVRLRPAHSCPQCFGLMSPGDVIVAAKNFMVLDHSFHHGGSRISLERRVGRPDDIANPSNARCTKAKAKSSSLESIANPGRASSRHRGDRQDR